MCLVVGRRMLVFRIRVLRALRFRAFRALGFSASALLAAICSEKVLSGQRPGLDCCGLAVWDPVLVTYL